MSTQSTEIQIPDFVKNQIQKIISEIKPDKSASKDPELESIVELIIQQRSDTISKIHKIFTQKTKRNKHKKIRKYIKSSLKQNRLVTDPIDDNTIVKFNFNDKGQISTFVSGVLKQFPNYS
jgi:hypothetical protein